MDIFGYPDNFCLYSMGSKVSCILKTHILSIITFTLSAYILRVSVNLSKYAQKEKGS